MRVAIAGYYTGRPVGSGRYTDRLVESLRAAVGAGDVVDVVPPPRPGRTAKVAYEQVGFPRAAAGADVAHVPYWAPPLRPRVPTVVTVHDLVPLLLREYRRSWVVRAYTALAARATRSAAAVIADSRHTADDVHRRLGIDRRRVHVVPLGVGEEYRPGPDPRDAAVSAALELPPRFGLYLGGFDPRKNVPTLLRSWREVHAATGVPLVIAGRPPRPDDALASSPAGLARQIGLPEAAVRLVGSVEARDLPGLYRRAAVFVYPSRYEGFGLPPLEAMACGTPVVAGRASSLPEVVGDAGLLVDPDDHAGLTAAVLAILRGSELAARLAAAGPARAAGFTWATTARLTREVYAAALDARASREVHGATVRAR